MSNLLLCLLSLLVCISLVLTALRRRKPVRSMITPALGDVQKAINEATLFEPVNINLDQHSFDTIVEPLFATEPLGDLSTAASDINSVATNEATGETPKVTAKPRPMIILYVMAPEGKQFFGYELLQVLLATGLCYGKMNIFHRYYDDESGAIAFSVASAIEPGVFDLDNMGAFVCPGLTLFMHVADDMVTANQQFDDLLQTAEQLADDLGGIICDDQRIPLTPEKLQNYLQQKMY